MEIVVVPLGADHAHVGLHVIPVLFLRAQGLPLPAGCHHQAEKPQASEEGEKGEGCRGQRAFSQDGERQAQAKGCKEQRTPPRPVPILRPLLTEVLLPSLLRELPGQISQACADTQDGHQRQHRPEERGEVRNPKERSRHHPQHAKAAAGERHGCQDIDQGFLLLRPMAQQHRHVGGQKEKAGHAA